MDPSTLALFALTVLPLICTPGPDILFTAPEGLSRGRPGALRAVAGVLLGYATHAGLSAVGVAAIVAASPALFAALKWAGVAYLGWLAARMLASALRSSTGVAVPVDAGRPSLGRGFLTAFLNPKGLLMYMAVLPQFIDPAGPAALQALLLSVVFLGGCALVYTAMGLLAARARSAGVSDQARRRLEAAAGVLLAGAAARIATSQ